ncbi:unnamed protein product [Urochloa humidicola]
MVSSSNSTCNILLLSVACILIGTVRMTRFLTTPMKYVSAIICSYHSAYDTMHFAPALCFPVQIKVMDLSSRSSCTQMLELCTSHIYSLLGLFKSRGLQLKQQTFDGSYDELEREA